ncbi:dihydropteroate synthase [Croceiramulus getboli]|nr:dihydropteroate synthase [Flavobacteriaceae bacterium YJPT1-3]
MPTINCQGRLFDLNTPRVMGILNATPDSFYANSRVQEDRKLLRKAEQMITEGASFLDLGAFSSRPGADWVSEEEEQKRLLPALERLRQEFPDIPLSVDTFRASVAQKAIDRGAAMINDISGGTQEPQLLKIAAGNQVPVILMHMRGTPQTMQDHTHYENVTLEVAHYLSEQRDAAYAAGVTDVIIDPGFGFAKTRAQNFELLNKLEILQRLECPVLVGLSRKSMIFQTLKKDAADALHGTTVLHSIALIKGAHLLRVHDVGEAMDCIALIQALQETTSTHINV